MPLLTVPVESGIELKYVKIERIKTDEDVWDRNSDMETSSEETEDSDRDIPSWLKAIRHDDRISEEAYPLE